MQNPTIVGFPHFSQNSLWWEVLKTDAISLLYVNSCMYHWIHSLGNTRFESIARKEYRYLLHTSLFSSNPVYACYVNTILFQRYVGWLLGSFKQQKGYLLSRHTCTESYFLWTAPTYSSQCDWRSWFLLGCRQSSWAQRRVLEGVEGSEWRWTKME